MLKPGELLMQLHHFAYHQQGGHRGVFRQVFELLQCAGYRLLIVTGAAGNHRHRRVAVATVGDQLGADFRRLHGAHVDRQRLLALRQHKDGALRIIAMGQRNTGVGCRSGGGGDARHHLERDPRLGGSLQLFCAAAKNKRIAALQTHDGFPRLRRLHQQLIGFMLRHRMLAGAFADANKFGIAAHQLENRLSHQMVVENHVRLLDRLQTAKAARHRPVRRRPE
ncbi:Uncharacterised protein [Klebsiella pneumoniae]|nr:Uncharacterised protein [Klebsiella pneumoniae]